MILASITIHGQAAVEGGNLLIEASGGAGAILSPAGDSDEDGLSDPWELVYFGNLDQNGTGNPDGDGLDNEAEESLGTNPTRVDTDGDGSK